MADSRAHTDWAHIALALLDVAAVEKEMHCGGISWPRTVATEVRGVPPTNSSHVGDEPENLGPLG